MRSAVILCGGKSSRFNCIDKTFIKFGMKPLLKHVIDSVSEVVDDIVIATQDDRRVEEIKKIVDLKIVFDSVKGFGPIAGILAGLEETSSEYAIILACDLPYTSGDIISLLFDQALGHDAAIPKWENDLIEPLYSIYKRDSMIGAARAAIEGGFHNVYYPISLLKKVNYVSMERIRQIDPELRTFVNINTPKDLESLEKGLSNNWDDL
ncbi:MAG: molybdenum cofactor guanylyltransferase [Halobacteriota archaeon]|nr:molybdenum cofactor guanylyltransferase [Halobacteriota archaeon]